MGNVVFQIPGRKSVITCIFELRRFLVPQRLPGRAVCGASCWAEAFSPPDLVAVGRRGVPGGWACWGKPKSLERGVPPGLGLELGYQVLFLPRLRSSGMQSFQLPPGLPLMPLTFALCSGSGQCLAGHTAQGSGGLLPAWCPGSLCGNNYSQLQSPKLGAHSNYITMCN